MKRFSLVFLLGITMALMSSCNNGDYSANPTGRVPSPGGSQDALPNVIDCNFYYINYVKFAGYWINDNGTRKMTGVSVEVKDGDTTTRNIDIYIAGYTGAGTYRLNDTANRVTISVSINGAHYGNAQGHGNAEVEVKTDGNGNMIGTFSAKLLGVANPGFNQNDSLNIAMGRFNISKAP